MHHLYPSLKGDQLCPLGFHPQTRYPTRCKRCFRDYKEHISRRGLEDTISSSPNLSNNVNSRFAAKSWMSTQNLSNMASQSNDIELKQRPLSWASTPDVEGKDSGKSETPANDNNSVNVTVKLPPARRHTTTFDFKAVKDELNDDHFKSSLNDVSTDDLTIHSSDSLAERVRKMSLLKKQKSLQSESNKSDGKPPPKSKKPDPPETPEIKPVDPKVRKKKLPPSGASSSTNFGHLNENHETNSSSKPSLPKSGEGLVSATTEKSTQSNEAALKKEIENLRKELENSKIRMERAEREKADFVLNRLALMEKSPNRTAASEALQLQKKVNDLTQQIETLRTQNRNLDSQIKSYERNDVEELKNKLKAAEQICGELMEENKQSKKEIVSLQTEMEELQDSFREDETKNKTNLQKELEKANKNCRVLSFKLKKYERKIEALERESQNSQHTECLAKFKELEEQLKISNEQTKQLQENGSVQSSARKKAPSLSIIGKSMSADSKFQLGPRDLNNLAEIESDLKEQIKFAEEEVESLRKRVARLEDENDSLMFQLKKISSRSKIEMKSVNRRIAAHERDEGISDEDDPSELRLLLELNEHEVSNLRQKVEEFDTKNNNSQKQIRELQEMLKKSNTDKSSAELIELRKANSSKDQTIAKLKEESLSLKSKLAEIKTKYGDESNYESLKKSLDAAEKERLHLKNQNKNLEGQLEKTLQKLSSAEADINRMKTKSDQIKMMEEKLNASNTELGKANLKTKELEEKCKNQEAKIQEIEQLQSTTVSENKKKILGLQSKYTKEKSEREKLQGKLTQFESELTSNRKSAAAVKEKLEKELDEYKKSSKSSDSNRVSELLQNIESLQQKFNEERQKFEEMKTNWEKLSEETVMMRAQLTTENKNLSAEVKSLKLKLSENETIRKERTEFAKKLKEAQIRILEYQTKDVKGGYVEQQKLVLSNKLREMEHSFELLKRENEMNIDLLSQMKKENEDLNSKLSDFQRIEQAQLSMNGHNASLEEQIKSLKAKLQSSESQLKSEVASTRLRYEQQLKSVVAELSSMQKQCERFKRDRDSLKQLLEVAEKKIVDLKANNTGRISRTSMQSSDEDDKNKITHLEQQLGVLEDQLMEAHFETSKIKMQLVSERSASEIKISEMQSKLNELEEDRVIGSGRTKIPGLKTKLELSWQKEREDQQRLLQETSTLARDLRQTLFEVERERDKERLESKRRLEQIKRSNDEEVEEGRKKIAELQYDLLELRDVHAKLRTTNEKLRKERERHDRDNLKRHMEQENNDKKLNVLLQTIDDFVKVCPTTNSKISPQSTIPTDASIIIRLSEAALEYKKYRISSEHEQERDRSRKSSLRKATSQDTNIYYNEKPKSYGKLSSTKEISIKKSFSLDTSLNMNHNSWKQEDGSLSSIHSDYIDLRRDSSLDSRLSGGSTQSDIPKTQRKKKKGLIGKLRNLTKSSRTSESELSIHESDSDISVKSDMRYSKKDLRERLSGIFKRSESASRSNSLERFTSDTRPVAVTIVGDSSQPNEEEGEKDTTNKYVLKPPTGVSTTIPRRIKK